MWPHVAAVAGRPIPEPSPTFIRRVFWPQQLPLLNDGILATLWTITHTIQAQPGGVAAPIRIVTLKKNEKDKWRAEEVSEGELGEHQQMIELMEEEMRKVKDTFFETEPTGPMPEEPKT